MFCNIYYVFRRHRCRHNQGAETKSSILPLEDDKGAVVGMFATKEEKMAFERKHSQVSAISNSKGV